GVGGRYLILDAEADEQTYELLDHCVFYFVFFFSSRRRHTRSKRDWSSDVCSSDLYLWNQLPHPPLKYESAIDQHRILNSRKANDYPWMYEVSKCAPQEALRDLGNAFHNFLIRRDRFRWPSFKSRHGAKHSFTLTGAVR